MTGRPSSRQTFPLLIGGRLFGVMENLKPRISERAAVSILVIGSLLAAGCDRVQAVPKLITADGQTYVACKDLVWVSSEGGILSSVATFKVSFTDAAGLGHIFRGVKMLEVSDLPRLIDAAMPVSPSMLTSDGKPVIEGQVYYWPNGTRARLHYGAWEAVKILNDACQAR